MGVAGLWEILAPAAKHVALSKLALDAFIENKGGHRAYRVGIDASLWIFHSRAVVATGGENPQLRTLFFKIINLLKRPLLPVFVFDGPHKPTFKRGARVAGHWGSHDRENKAFKALLDIIGLERHDAPGEAEAELAVMNQKGEIDAVLSDDVDALLFGAKVLLRNPSANLSQNVGAKVAAGTAGHIYQVYTADAILEHFSSLSDEFKTAQDCTDAMILVALMGGGDYRPEGLEKCGPKISFALAQSGLHKFLAAKRLDSLFDVSAAKQDIEDELRTNAHGFLSSKRKALADDLATSKFPEEDVMHSYLHPRVSGWGGFKRPEKERGSLEGLALASERFFEWGNMETVVRRFRSAGPWEVEAVSQLRLRVLERDGVRDKISLAAKASSPPRSSSPIRAEPSSEAGPSQPRGHITSFFSQSMSRPAPAPLPTRTIPSTDSLKANITSTRTHASTDAQLEYRLEFSPADMVQRVRSCMLGTRKELSKADREQLGLRTSDAPEEEGETESKNVDPEALLRCWALNRLVELGAPESIIAFEKAQREKELRKTPKKTPRKEVKKTTKIKPSSPTPRTGKQRDLMSAWLGQMPKSPTQTAKQLVATSPARSSSPPLVRHRPSMSLNRPSFSLTPSDDSDDDFEILSSAPLAAPPKRPPPSISGSSEVSSSDSIARPPRKVASPVKTRRKSISRPPVTPSKSKIIDLSLDTDSDGTPLQPALLSTRPPVAKVTKPTRSRSPSAPPRPPLRTSTTPPRYRVLSCNSDEEVLDCT